MAHVLLFHHVQGLTDGVRAFAERLRQAGHRVTLPDLFDGRTFPTIEAGMAYARQIGDDMIAEAGAAAARDMPEDLVYAGFSMGVAPAMKLVQQRPGASGALFLYGVAPLDYFGGTWPNDVPLQIHIARNDPYEDPDEVRALAAAAEADLFVYDAEAHLFTDSSVEGYDERAAEMVFERVLKFLQRVSGAKAGVSPAGSADSNPGLASSERPHLL